MNFAEDLEALIRIFTPEVQEQLRQLENYDKLLEIVVDVGRPISVRFAGGEHDLDTKDATYDDLNFAVNQIGMFRADNRAGIDKTLHRVSCIRNRDGAIVGLTCRVGRAVLGCAKLIQDIIESGRSVLILGKPGVGKTTVIRDISRILADDQRKRVVIVDTSNEIGGDGDIPHRGIGRARRMQVKDFHQQWQTMIEAVENHMPQVVVIDEIGNQQEAEAAKTIAERGVQLVGTAHGIELENVVKNPSLNNLVGGVVTVTLGDEEARKRFGKEKIQKSIQERAGLPTFDVCIEIENINQWKVHDDVANSVDRILRDLPPAEYTLQRGPNNTVLTKHKVVRKIKDSDEFSRIADDGFQDYEKDPQLGKNNLNFNSFENDWKGDTVLSRQEKSLTKRLQQAKSFSATNDSEDESDEEDRDEFLSADGTIDYDLLHQSFTQEDTGITDYQEMVNTVSEKNSTRIYTYQINLQTFAKSIIEQDFLGKVKLVDDLKTANAIFYHRASAKDDSVLEFMRKLSNIQKIPMISVKSNKQNQLNKQLRGVVGVMQSIDDSINDSINSFISQDIDTQMDSAYKQWER